MTKVKNSKDLSSAKQEASISIDEGNFFLQSSLGEHEERELDPHLKTRLVARRGLTNPTPLLQIGPKKTSHHAAANTITRNLRPVEQYATAQQQERQASFLGGYPSMEAEEVVDNEGLQSFTQASPAYLMAILAQDGNQEGLPQ